MVGNQKGGVGKTTNTVHIAAALAERGHLCLIWDLDMNCNATKQFDVPPESLLGTFEVLIGAEKAADVILRPGELEHVMTVIRASSLRHEANALRQNMRSLRRWAMKV